MENQYDIIVVGAGPAGLSVSLECSKAGLSVLLIEESDFSESENSWITLQSALENYPLLKDATTNTVNRLKFYGSRGLFDSGNTSKKGYFIEQAALNKVYKKEIEKNSNCQILEKTFYLETKRKGDQVEVETSKGFFTGKVIVDASGSYSVVARDLMTPQEDFWFFMCYFLRIYKKEALDDQNCVIFSHGGDKANLVGTAGALYPNSKDFFDIGVANYLRSGKDTGEMQTVLKEQLINLWHFFQKEGLIKKGVEINFEKKFYSGIRVSPRKVIYDDNLVIVGDAAGQGSPITGEGLRTGLYYGEMAAETIIKSVKSGDYSKKSLKSYSDSCKRKPLFGYGYGLIIQKLIRDNLKAPPFGRFQKIYNEGRREWLDHGLDILQNKPLPVGSAFKLLMKFAFYK